MMKALIWHLIKRRPFVLVQVVVMGFLTSPVVLYFDAPFWLAWVWSGIYGYFMGKWTAKEDWG